MIYAWIDGVKRSPINKGERTTCPDCGSLLLAVIPTEKVKHWRHKGSDCDNWSEPEGEWHLAWKEHFEPDCREICLLDEVTGERHRADIFCGAGTPNATVLELQHSYISEDERLAREKFYKQDRAMFWLVHIHDQYSLNASNFGLSWHCTSKTDYYTGRKFHLLEWQGHKNFIEKWKRSSAHVFFDWKGNIFYLANIRISKHLGIVPFRRGEFAVCSLTKSEFIDAVLGKRTES